MDPSYDWEPAQWQVERKAKELAPVIGRPWNGTNALRLARIVLQERHAFAIQCGEAGMKTVLGMPQRSQHSFVTNTLSKIVATAEVAR